MTKRICRSIYLVAIAVLLACLAVTMGVLYNRLADVQKNALRTQTALAAQGLQGESVAYFDGLDAGDCRITWVASDGTVLYDSVTDAAAMENHAGREEIQEARTSAIGESERTSATLTEKTFYRAQRLSDGTVLRLSVTQQSVLALTMRILRPLLIVLAAAVVVSSLLARKLSRRIVGPLNTLDLDHPLDNDAYDELSPLLTRIERQHRQIEEQLAELTKRQEAFAAVTQSMNEGLVLLDAQGRILSVNPAAARLFRVDEACVGKDMLTVDRSLEMQRLILAAQSGRHSETHMQLCGQTYQFDASPVRSDGAVAGVCILAFDITQRAEAERRRREFSANVSHELKTPLQTIMGGAELMERGMVKPEDLTRFAGRIRTEAERLVALINDIIRLSELDEGGQPPREDVELVALAREVAQALAPAADARHVRIDVRGQSATVRGVRRMLHEIVYNLADNAIQYNVDGGHVEIAVSEADDGVTLAVSDSGVGIPPEAQPRVFERFYRVDKSHARQTGGTGLGLSIVKHAAQYHGAKLELVSAPGKGTRVTVRFSRIHV